ncbi:MAG: polymerase sigma-54 factor RpoN [Myxococcaceae bacterium]|nr:polymerase sigma-54 factor RpoN [Myxococcaceae bacterium]
MSHVRFPGTNRELLTPFEKNVNQAAPTVVVHHDRLTLESAALVDEEVVARVQAGEVHLFELLMRRHNGKVYRVVRAILRRDSEAEDVMQDAYVRAYEHLAEFRGEARFSTWLTRIAVHEALARVRRERRFDSFDASVEESTLVSQGPEVSPERQAMSKQTRAILDSAVDALPDEFRLVFVLRAIEQLSGAETAEALGIPEQTVKTRFHRARERLKKEIAPTFDPADATAYEFHLARCDRVVNAVMQRIGTRRDDK